MNEKELAFNLEGVIGDYLDDGEHDLPYGTIEGLAKHVAGWVKVYEETMIDNIKEELDKCHRKLMKR